MTSELKPYRPYIGHISANKPDHGTVRTPAIANGWAVGGGATSGTLVDVLLANVIRDGSARNSSKP
jgi:hypothetical protein